MVSPNKYFIEGGIIILKVAIIIARLIFIDRRNKSKNKRSKPMLNIQMWIKQIIQSHPKLKRFCTKWRILMWKAVLMRLHNPICTALEIIIAIFFSLQIRFIFEPYALHPKDLDRYSREDILRNLPNDVQCWYAPKNAFVEELMLKAAKMLHTNFQAADNEISLIHSRYTTNDTSKVLWAIFKVDKNAKPRTLEYKIRSSEIGETRIMIHEEKPFYKDPYILSGFMALQMAIETSFVEMWTNPTLPSIADNLTIGRFPLYKADVLIRLSAMRSNLSIIYYMIVIAFILIPITTLRKALHDKETGFRGLMRLTDMSFSMLYVGWFNYLMITLLPVTIICTIILYPIFFTTNAFVIIIFIMMYNIISVLFMLTIGTFFNHSTKAILISIIFWLFLTHFTIVLDQFLLKISIPWKISSLILPHNGLLHGLIAFTSYTDFDYNSESLRNVLMKPYNYINSTSYLWPRWVSELIVLQHIHDIVHTKEKISIDMILFIWSLHIIFWYLLTIYLDNINPGKFGSAKSWYYLCKKINPNNDELMLRGSTNWSAVEHVPSYIKPSVQVRCVSKEFSRFGERLIVIDKVTINFYQKEFTVILGHNGGGKSCLLKMIIGMYKPTRGYVYLEGRDYNDYRNFTDLIGFCPQENIMVNYLTTIQHIYIFGMMRGMTYKQAYKKSLKLLKQLDLESVKDAKIKSCSLNVQRRICLAMALIGDTKILILDEPAYGIDPQHTKYVWDLLWSIKRKKTIIMATNSMEVTELLADRIAIIINGRIECYGSKMYLNRRYGIGYILNVLVQEGCNVQRVHTEIQEFSSDPIILRSMMGLVIRFDIARRTQFTKLLKYLERNKEELQIVSATLSAASIEGQFLRIALESQFKERCTSLPYTKYELIMQKRRQHLLQTAIPWERLTDNALWRQQVFAMFYKKLLHIVSSWKLYTFSIILAIITLILTTIINELNSFIFIDTTERIMNLTNYINNNFNVLFYTADDISAKNFLVALYTTSQIYSERYNFHISKNIPGAELIAHSYLHSIEFRDKYIMSVDVHMDGYVQLMYSSTAIHSGPIALNMLHNALLHYHTKSDHYIKLTNRPIIKPKQWQYLLIHPRSVRNWENAAIIITLFLVLPSIDMGIREKNTIAKMLQINTIGMSTRIYWISMYIIDFLLYAFFIIFLEIVILIAYHRTLDFSALEVVQVLIIFLCYGGCAISLGYCIQLFTRKLENVYLIIILINIMIVLLINDSIIFPLVFDKFSNTGRYVFEIFIHIFPPYVLACTLSNYVILSLYNRQCSYFNTCNTEFYIEDPCCQSCKGKDCYKQLNVMLAKQSGTEYYHSVADDIFLMIFQIVLLHIILEIFEEKNRRKWCGYFMPSMIENQIEDTEVMEEKKRVEEHVKHYDETQSLPSHVTLVVQNLRKEYAGQEVIQGINFNVYNQDCFGLLGFNEAGKSTVYKMLMGEIKMSAGRAIMCGYEFTRDQEKFIGMIGYCPQIDGLSDFMTGRQCLQLHAALRGIPYKYLNDEVDKWLDLLDMLDFETLEIADCPWGVQRKFCVLQSLIGNLPMIFMDEPSVGIDIMAKHALCEILYQIREMGRSILITTYSMREAEAMCLRVGILSNGQFVAIGSCEHLRAKYGRNFMLTIKVLPGFQLENLEQIKKTIEDTFPTIKFIDSYLGILKYELECVVLYSYVFNKLEKLKQRYVWMTDFSVNQPSMDEVLLTLAKDQREPFQKLTLYKRLRSWIMHIIHRI